MAERNDLAYMAEIRRRLHRHPETGFDLPETVALVKKELDSMGIPYREDLCPCSVVGLIDPGKSGKTIALRADMDALPIFEKNQTEYASQNEGKMHACGHDAHTAMLLGAVRKLMRRKDEIPCRVKLIFQPSEEGMATGARVLVDHGVMDDVDFILGEHVDNRMDVGNASVGAGVMYASNNVFELTMIGRSAHASQPENGVDAIYMAVEWYRKMREMLKTEIPPTEKKVLNVGMIRGGTAVNSIPKEATLTCTLRTYRNEIADLVMRRVGEIAEETAKAFGGEYELKSVKNLPCVCNDGSLSEKIASLGREIFKNVEEEKGRMGSEDFACYQTKKPGVIYTIGSGNAAKGITSPLHSDQFDLDENVLEYGATLLSEAVFRLGKE